MSVTTAKPDQDRSQTRDNAPRGVVRADKTFVCSACGTLVEVPAKVVGRMVQAVENSPPEVPVDEAVPPANDRPVKPAKPRVSASKKVRRIDGLRLPSAAEMERGFAWVSFHLKLLGLQGSEFKRLQKRLKKHRRTAAATPHTTCVGADRPRCTSKRSSNRRVPRVRLRDHVKEALAMNWGDPPQHASPKHAPADISMLPESNRANERGPP
ncbi:hypothetical protein [Bremerella alba]|uniref:Uncharacterized protein n=1 Tax=Bremerella alba TaxID=980252 RepID=A0A7V8VA20_9BACT|nr:hypothetical protein [Bremerella alba]MBA2117734.1 hypothetical protein [Bremerella alba]